MKSKLSKNQKWIKDIFYPILIQYQKIESDYIVQQSINTYIGWVNCLNFYNIEPNKQDMSEIKEYYKIAKGAINE